MISLSLWNIGELSTANVEHQFYLKKPAVTLLQKKKSYLPQNNCIYQGGTQYQTRTESSRPDIQLQFTLKSSLSASWLTVLWLPPTWNHLLGIVIFAKSVYLTLAAIAYIAGFAVSSGEKSRLALDLAARTSHIIGLKTLN